MKSSLPHILALCLLPGLGVAQGVPTNDSGLTARDIVETGDRGADLAVQADKLAVRELIAEIEREQLETLQRILDAQTSFGGQGLPAMVSGLESGSGDPARSVEAVYGNADIDPNPGGAQMFGDAAENIEQLIIRVAQETSDFAGVGRAGLSPVQWRALLQALIFQCTPRREAGCCAAPPALRRRTRARRGVSWPWRAAARRRRRPRRR